MLYYQGIDSSVWWRHAEKITKNLLPFREADDLCVSGRNNILEICISSILLRYSCMSGGRAVECRTFNGRDGSLIPPIGVQKFRQFRSPQICLSFGRDTKSQWSLLCGVYPRGSRRSHTCKCVTCSGLTNSCGTLNALQRAPSSI